MKPEVIVIGAGFAGSVAAERLANGDGKHVLLLEKRGHIGGNMYDYIDENGVRRHEYGPHIFHTNNKEVVDYLSQFTDWYSYQHCVLGHINGVVAPVPFNLTTIERSFDKEKADRLKELLINEYGMEKKVPILTLRANANPEINELAEYIYEHVFKYCTMKQWGQTPEEIDPAVTGRVPVHISYDARYFQDTYQQMPSDGYTALFEKMLSSDNIEIRLNTDARDVLKVDTENKKIYFEGEEFTGSVIFTGAIDELLDYPLGELPYRSLEFDVQSHPHTFQQAATENYPTPAEQNAFTRITEYKLFMPKDQQPEATTIAVEYPMTYHHDAEKGNIPYYPIAKEECRKQYEAYCDLIKDIPNLHLLGRLAEYQYYNMDALIAKALQMYNNGKLR